MRNALRILKRDLLRLLKSPAALIVVGALLVLPSVYSWYNVVAFWNPYEETGNLKVCVVNRDAGVESNLVGSLNVGNRVTEQLLGNEQLDFVSETHDAAMAKLKAGAVYAVYEIPEDFSERLISPVSGHVETPQIDYYVNEKLGPVSPKITDRAANTLSQTINSAFVTAVSEAAVNRADEAADKAKEDVADARAKATSRMDEAVQAVADVRQDLADVLQANADAMDKVASASAATEDASKLTSDSRAVLDDVAAETGAVQESLSTAATTSIGSLSDILADASQAASKASTAVDGFLSKVGEAQTRVDMAAGRAQPVVNALADIAEDLQKVADALPEGGAVQSRVAEAAKDAADRQAKLQTIVDDAQMYGSHIADAAQTATDTAGSLEEAAQQTATELENYSQRLYGDMAPTVNSSLAQVVAACERLSAATVSLDATIGQTKASLDQLNGLLGDCSEAVEKTDALVGGFQGDLETISADMGLLAQSNVLAQIVEHGSLDAEGIGSFMGAPTELKTERLYHPNAYGTAMAPLFMNLTFWIGAFMLIIILRLEVDDEGIEKATPAQRYLGRFMLFAIFAAIQGLVCSAGVLALGVQAANPPALFLAAAVCSLAFLSIIYMLSSTLRHIGQALCIILVFAQIPGGSGLYPLELTDRFFQTVYPLLPFTYGIGAMREAIGGFYGNYFAYDIAVLAAFFVFALAAGIVLGPLMPNVIRMASAQIYESDLYNGEKAITPERPYRLAQVAKALADRAGYREGLERRYARFSKLYPVFIRASVVLAVGVPLALTLLLALDAGDKVVLLTGVLLWLVCLVVFLVVVESLRCSFERQLDIDRMSDEGLIKVFSLRNHMRAASDGARSDAEEAADA